MPDSFLDMDIKIKDNRFSISLHEKREDFPFPNVRMLYLCSNISSQIF